MFHLGAYFAAIDDTVDIDVPALTDDILTIQNNHFVLGQPLQLIGAAAMAPNMLRARLASPSMRQIANPYIRPIMTLATPGPNPNMWLLDYNPFVIRPFEEVQLLATNDATGPENCYALAWLADAITPLPSGNIIPLRVTSTTTAVASTWTTLSVTFQDTLPGGAYAMVFSEHFADDAVAHRWIVPNQMWRPGFLSAVVIDNRQPYAISKGQFGLMGRFRSNDLPRLQVLCDGANAVHEIYLYVIRIGDIGIPYGPF